MTAHLVSLPPERCVCGAPVHHGRSCVQPQTPFSLKAAKAQQLKDRTESLAHFVALLTDADWHALPALERSRRRQQARQMLREHDLAAVQVARYRAEQAVRGLLSEMCRRTATPGMLRQFVLAALNAYQISLEGLGREGDD